MMKSDPRPGSLCTISSPPMRRHSFRLIASPSPVPPNCRVVDVSAWVKASKMRSCWSGAMPMPVSRTENRSVWAEPPAAATSWKPTVTTTSPSIVNFIALPMMFTSTCLIRSRSP